MFVNLLQRMWVLLWASMEQAKHTSVLSAKLLAQGQDARHTEDVKGK